MSHLAQKKASPNLRNSTNTEDIVIKDKVFYLFNKRLFDIIGSIVGIIVLFPLFIVTTISIKLEDPKGPVFFSQKRIGKDGRVFNMYKFRSMVTDAEERLLELLVKNETTGPMFKMKEDPRITKVGRLIRKTSIDELPQLINVLKGEMTLVGPRPPLPREVEKYTEYDKQRLLVVPGCTGLWQVSGRSNIGFDEMVKLDIAYIQKRSFFMDLSIIIKTIFMLFGSKNAY